MDDAESDPGLLTDDSNTSGQRAKLRALKKFKRLSRTDSSHELTDPTANMPEDDPAPNGELPPGPKHKHRMKLWDSFLQKTRKIRVRTKEKSPGGTTKLQKRSRSHPNISSFSSGPSSPDSSSKTFPLSKGPDDIPGQSDDHTADSRRDKFRQQRETSYAKSSISLNDSACEPSVPTPDKTISRVSFRHSDVICDDGYRSSYDHSTSTFEMASPSSPEVMSKEDSAERSSFDNCYDKDADDEDEDEDDDDDVLVIEKDLLQVSKSVDSLLAVASSISLPPDATIRTSLRPERHSLQQYSSESSGSSTASSGRVRRHSYDYTIKDKREDSVEYFDCQDGASDGDFTSSSQEPSPIRHPKEAQYAHYRGERRLIKRQSTLSSLGLSTGFASDRESADSDFDERNSNILDLDASLLAGSEEDSFSFSESPTITVHTCLAQDPSLVPVGQHLSNQHSFYLVNIHLREGKDLVIRDACGTSDPYVKFKIGSKVVYKSRTVYKNLNPRWNERFTISVDDINKPLIIKVFDYDRAWNDDPMGGADLDLTTLDLNKETELKLLLTEKGKEDYMGYIALTCTLVPKSFDEKEQFFRRSARVPETSKKAKMQLWSGVVNIVLVEGSNLVSMDDNGLSDPYVKFRLGMEKYRSKFKSKTLKPCWLEQFDLRLYEEQTTQLEIMVFDRDSRGKDDFMGRAVIDLSQLEKDRTHVIEQQLEDGAGIIKLLLTITGIIGSEVSSDQAAYSPNVYDRDSIITRYGFFNTFTALNDIGHLEVKAFRAHGLPAADFGGLSDPFCVLELVNDRVQTHTEYKTLNPEWGKVFTFQVKDLHSVLEVTVYDEDRNKKVEFLGKVAIPLLKIRNGERRWYALKDRKMVHKSKGAILLEMDLVFNHIKAGIRTINPREEKFMLPEPKFKISIMKQNINRVSQLIGVVMDTGRFVQSCFDWQSPPRSITAFVVYLLIVWNFELYMLPISLLLIFMKNLVVAQIVGSLKKEPIEDDSFVDEDDDDDDDKEKQEEKKSIVDRYHAIQEVCLTVQQGLDMVASLGERVKNTFKWSVPWLSILAVIALLAGSVVLFFIPLRLLLLAWGINKFTKKLRAPNAISNNELLDFLSRVPSDNELLQYRELKPDIPSSASSNRKKRS